MNDDTRCPPNPVKRYDWERVLKATEAEPLTKLVGFMLATYTSGRTGTNAHPGIERLRQDCGIGNERTIRRHLGKLVDLGLIERTFHASRAGRGGLSDVHHSSRLALARDTSQADEDDDIETLLDRLDAWAVANTGRGLDIGSESRARGMDERGVPWRVIENTVRRDLRDWQEAMPEYEPYDMGSGGESPF